GPMRSANASRSASRSSTRNLGLGWCAGSRTRRSGSTSPTASRSCSTPRIKIHGYHRGFTRLTPGESSVKVPERAGARVFQAKRRQTNKPREFRKMATFNEILSQVKQGIREVSVEDTRARIADRSTAPVLIDIRERDEYEQGFIPSAEWIPRGFLELKVEDLVADRDHEIIVYCAGGTRSALGARSLSELGYKKVTSMAGGFRAWKNAGF